MSIKGMVFDIQRFSLHDGPGIRTTVFLKGCPLRCAWCHNPESWSIIKQLMYKEEKCTHCMACTFVCPTTAHTNKGGHHFFNREVCKSCGKCVKVCINDALIMSGKSMCVNEVITEVIKDSAYYVASGGGITISGGEPMFQFDFCLALLKGAKGLELHTCMETSGMAPTANYSKIAEYVDLFLFDIKALNNDKHITYTGASNNLILKNLEYIYSLGKEIILRCPVIPNINDDNDDIEGINKLANKYKLIKSIEFLPYHNFGKNKWKELGKKDPLEIILGGIKYFL